MDKALKHKLIEIFVDKLLIGLIVLIVGLWANASLEHYKLIDAQRVGDTTEFVKACQEIWAKVFAYETTIDEIGSLRRSQWLYKTLGGKQLKDEEKIIAEKAALSKQQLTDIQEATNARKFIIGSQLVTRYWQYVGLVNVRADAKLKSLDAEGAQAKESQELIDELNKNISSMRFTSDMAREYAVSRIPR